MSEDHPIYYNIIINTPEGKGKIWLKKQIDEVLDGVQNGNSDEISRQLAASAANSASNAMGFQVTRLVDMGVNGFLNLLFSQSKEDKLKENEEHTNRLLNIVNSNKPTMRQPQMRLTPRESVEKDIRESNEHINTAIVELERAREKSKCGVCKHTLDETIDLVSEKTGEILDVSEKSSVAKT